MNRILSTFAANNLLKAKDEKEQQKLFGTLFGLSATVVAIVFILNLVGIMGFIG